MPSASDSPDLIVSDPVSGPMDRRTLLRGGLLMAASLPLAGCYSVGLHDQPALPGEDFDYEAAYAATSRR